MMSADFPLPEPTATRPANRLRNRAVIGGFLALFLAGLIGLATTTGWDETRDYVPKVLAAWQVAQGLCLSPPELVTDPCVFKIISASATP